MFQTGDTLCNKIDAMFMLSDNRFEYLGFLSDFNVIDERKYKECLGYSVVDVQLSNRVTRNYCTDLMISWDVEGVRQ